MNNRVSGILYAIAAAFLLSTAFVTLKKLLEYVNLPSLIFQYFGLATVFLFIIILARKEIKFFEKIRREFRAAVVISVFGIITAVMFQASVKLLDPAFFAFVMRLSIMTTLLLGVILLKEKFTRIEALGTALAVIGTIVLTYSSGRFLPLSILFGVITAVIIGIQDFTWKKMVKAMHPIAINFYRTLAITVALFLYLLYSRDFQLLPVMHTPLLVIAVAASPVFGVASMVTAMSKLEVSKVVAIRTLEPFIVVIYAFVFLSTLPTLQELAGGTLIVAGVATTTLFHTLKKGRVAPSEG